jgi:aryl-alcohol dehydrogenase-like predicted oxidoreductase
MSQALASLPIRRLGGNGPRVPIIGFGAEALGRKGRLLADAERTLHAVIDAGVRLIDTASSYGNSERFVGQALAARRDEVTLVTKCGWTSALEPRWTPAEIASTIDESLSLLATDVIDVLLLHSCPLEMLQRGDVIESIERARDAGKVRQIGYSGDNDALAFGVDCGRFDVIETTFNMLDRGNAAAIDRAATRGIGVLAKRPLANAVPGRGERPRSDYAAQYWPRWEAFRGASDAVDQADADNLTWLERAARFSSHAPGITCALVGSSHASHVADIIAAVTSGPLPDALLAAMKATYQRVDANWPALG